MATTPYTPNDIQRSEASLHHFLLCRSSLAQACFGATLSFTPKNTTTAKPNDVNSRALSNTDVSVPSSTPPAALFRAWALASFPPRSIGYVSPGNAVCISGNGVLSADAAAAVSHPPQTPRATPNKTLSNVSFHTPNNRSPRQRTHQQARRGHTTNHTKTVNHAMQPTRRNNTHTLIAPPSIPTPNHPVKQTPTLSPTPHQPPNTTNT